MWRNVQQLTCCCDIKLDNRISDTFSFSCRQSVNLTEDSLFTLTLRCDSPAAAFKKQELWGSEFCSAGRSDGTKASTQRQSAEGNMTGEDEEEEQRRHTDDDMNLQGTKVLSSANGYTGCVRSGETESFKKLFLWDSKGQRAEPPAPRGDENVLNEFSRQTQSNIKVSTELDGVHGRRQDVWEEQQTEEGNIVQCWRELIHNFQV